MGFLKEVVGLMVHIWKIAEEAGANGIVTLLAFEVFLSLTLVIMYVLYVCRPMIQNIMTNMYPADWHVTMTKISDVFVTFQISRSEVS